MPQAEALDRLLAERGLKLDGVIELKVDEAILLKRIEHAGRRDDRARREAARRRQSGGAQGRLAVYRAQTAPLIGYYGGKGMLKAVDGMAPIDTVTAAIDRILAAGKAKPSPPQGQGADQEAGQARRQSRAAETPKSARKAARKPARKAAAGRRKTRLDSANRRTPAEVDEGADESLNKLRIQKFDAMPGPGEPGTGVVLRFALSPSRDLRNSARMRAAGR